MELQPHQQRVVDENNEVTQFAALTKERADNLVKFINGNPIFKDLPEKERARLECQLAAMNKVNQALADYSTALADRIAAFPS